jgi:corrinoid protein of di/trimethylamine methyltransferase
MLEFGVLTGSLGTTRHFKGDKITRRAWMMFNEIDIKEKGDIMSKEELLAGMAKAVIEGNKEEAVALAEEAIAEKMDLNEVIEKGYVPGIQVAGKLWEEGEYFLPELVTSAECMKAAMGVLRPELEKAHIDVKSAGKVVIGTVEGDIHDIGKNLVASILSANGFDVVDLGADVKLEKFIEKAEEEKADIICLSALLTTTMIGQRKLVEMLKARNLFGRFAVMVGGAPVSQKWADDIGADGYAENALTAVQAAKNLLKK